MGHIVIEWDKKQVYRVSVDEAGHEVILINVDDQTITSFKPCLNVTLVRELVDVARICRNKKK